MNVDEGFLGQKFGATVLPFAAIGADGPKVVEANSISTQPKISSQNGAVFDVIPLDCVSTISNEHRLWISRTGDLQSRRPLNLDGGSSYVTMVEASTSGVMGLPHQDLGLTKDGTCPQQVDFMDIEPRSSSAFGVTTNHVDDVPFLDSSLQMTFRNETTEMTTDGNHVPFLLPCRQATSVNISGPGYAPTFNSTDGRQTVIASELQKQDQSLPIPSRPPTLEDWNAYRAIFTTLYREENKTLSRTKEIMRDRYRFHASNRMFNKRIDEWQLHKNAKAAEKEAVLRSMKQHEKLGVYLGQPMLKGKVLEPHRLERYRKEKRKFDYLAPEGNCSLDDGRESNLLLTSDTKPNMVNSTHHVAKRSRKSYQASLAHISFSRIDDPTQYRNVEHLLVQLDHYYTSKLANDPLASFNAWVESSAPPGGAVHIPHTFQGISRVCKYTDPADIFGRYSSIGHLLDLGHQKAAWRQAHEGAEMVRTCLQTESPQILKDIVRIWANTSRDHYSDVLRQLLRQFSSMATIIYGKHHPISSVCRALRSLQPDYNVTVLAQRKLLDIFKQNLGDYHVFSVRMGKAVSDNWIAWGEYDEAERFLSQSLKSCELRRGRHDIITCGYLYELARLSFCWGRYFEAEDILIDVLRRLKDGGEAHRINFLANELLGMVYHIRGNFDAAEALLWMALSGTLLQGGPQDSWTTEMWVTYLWMRGSQWRSEEVMTSEDDGVTFCRASNRPPGQFTHSRAQSLPPKSPDREPYNIWDEAPV